MFSPTTTPPPSDGESVSEDELDLPLINLTPKKTKIEGNCANPVVEQGHAPRALLQASTAGCYPVCASNTVLSPTKDSSPPKTPSNSLVSAAAAADEIRERLFKNAKGEVKQMADGLSNLSPIKGGIGGNDRGANDSKRLVKKVQKIARSLKAKTELEKKLEEYRAQNGIQGIARREEEKLRAQQSKCPDKDATPDDINALMAAARNRPRANNTTEESTLSSSVPDRPVFICQPTLITELYPPGLSLVEDRGSVGGLLLEGNSMEIKKIVCSGVLSLSYSNRPCPPELVQWLFQLLGCAADGQVSNWALKNLLEFLKISNSRQWSFPAPTIAEITDVLVSQGAERERLLPTPISESSICELSVKEEKPIEVGPSRCNLVNLISYITEIVKSQVVEFTVQETEELVLLLCCLHLDKKCRLFLTQTLQVCIHYILITYPDTVWPKARTRLSGLLIWLSLRYHHHQVLLARLLCGTAARERGLLREFCHCCMLRMVTLPPVSHSDDLNTAKTVDDKNQNGGEEMELKTDTNPPPPSLTISNITAENGIGSEVQNGTDSVSSTGSSVNTEPPHIQSSSSTNSANGKEVGPMNNGIKMAELSTKPVNVCTGTDQTCGKDLSKTTVTEQRGIQDELTQLSSGKFAKRVIEAFLKSTPRKMTAEDYQKLETILRLLTLQNLEFSSGVEREQFLRVIRTLKLTIKEDPTLSITSQVKDLVIQLVLELQGNKTSSSSNTLLDQFFTS